jgi:hypothetical protein
MRSFSAGPRALRRTTPAVPPRRILDLTADGHSAIASLYFLTAPRSPHRARSAQLGTTVSRVLQELRGNNRFRRLTLAGQARELGPANAVHRTLATVTGPDSPSIGRRGSARRFRMRRSSSRLKPL